MQDQGGGQVLQQNLYGGFIAGGAPPGKEDQGKSSRSASPFRAAMPMPSTSSCAKKKKKDKDKDKTGSKNKKAKTKAR